MNYISTRNTNELTTLSYAIQKGLAYDGGLFVPEFFPKIDWQNIDPNLSYPEFAEVVLKSFFKGDQLEPYLKEICQESFNFEVPLLKLEDKTFILELTHGPTLSFKDFGARFLASCLSKIKTDKTFTIIVATSGDTGSAVAAAFHEKPNIRVIVLFPENKISKRQEAQITCWGDNVLAVAVNGNFDDCQALVKGSFSEKWWHERTSLNTANSINIGRLLPQLSYYCYTSWKYLLKHNKEANFIIPTGNIGNATAAFWAKKLGFPIAKIVLSQNENNTVCGYLASGKYIPQSTRNTLANAMDVGNPSNFERLAHMFPGFNDFKKNVIAFSVTDEQIVKTILEVSQTQKLTICPHTATAFYVQKQLINQGNNDWIVVSTADPCKFEAVIEPILKKEISPTAELEFLLNKPQNKVLINNDMEALQQTYKMFFNLEKLKSDKLVKGISS